MSESSGEISQDPQYFEQPLFEMPDDWPPEEEAWPLPQTAEDVKAMVKTHGLSEDLHVIALEGVTRRTKYAEQLEREAKESETRRADAEKDRADHDDLTGVLRRNAFERAVEAHRAAHPDEEALLIKIDIGNFKGTNTILGHEGGDKVIVSVVRAAWQREDDIIGRPSGDELWLYIPIRKAPKPEAPSPEAMVVELVDKDLPPAKVTDIPSGAIPTRRNPSATEQLVMQLNRVRGIRELIVKQYPQLVPNPDAYFPAHYVGAGGVVYDPNLTFEENLIAADKLLEDDQVRQRAIYGAFRTVALPPGVAPEPDQ